ncbi:glycoside hydrolase family 51 protein [Sphaerobolus stellatus SS14]|uniref:non-reducing end alpha-L-arabinofuranosidase n=1 Tax=Sphaerobolus stellatus (strain SS14) TaxID=990650 RepID=A0A0C9W434_SPHS4|nr:glycoside hydrolase family 51 protein [Sphaerobolus stellatus SS14]
MRRSLCVLSSILALVATATAVTVTVSSTASHPIPTTLWGLMFESGDGGLYGELLQNRAFQLVTPGTTGALAGWQAVNGATVSVIKESTPVSSALPNALHLTIPSGKTGPTGFGNVGYNSGLKVTAGSTYTASFYYRFPTSSSFSGSVTVGLQTAGGQALGSTTATISGSQTSWQQVTVTFQATTTPSSTSNLFTVTLDGAAASGQNINFAMLSLFPPTFKNRANGMRQDIAQALADIAPASFRFPGGNNLEGNTVSTRWQWNTTVGPLTSRPGRQGDWGYVNTDGLGLLEYLNWCEDLNMEPLMAVWSGYSLGGTSVAQDQLGPYIQQAIDQINFVVGDPTKSAAAALRSSLGHPAPFKLNYVEIGNEDFAAASTYPYRWTAFVNALQAQFPNIQFMATTYVNNPVLSPTPQVYDVHVYQSPSWFVANAFQYDDMARNGQKYFEGEYAVISTNDADVWSSTGRLVYPIMQGSASEAAFMLGLERNSDIVFAACYAPLIGNVNNNQWTPNLLGFDAGAVYKSTSYYVQKLFGNNRGDQYIPSTLPTRNGTLHWGVVKNTAANQLIIKIANTASSTQSLTFNLPFSVASSGTAQILTGGASTSNTPQNPNAIVPTTSTISTGQTDPLLLLPQASQPPPSHRPLPHLLLVALKAFTVNAAGPGTRDRPLVPVVQPATSRIHITVNAFPLE